MHVIHISNIVAEIILLQIKERGMTMSIGDKIFNKLTGRKVETIKIDQDQAINLIQELFIDPADSDKELDEIYKLISFIGIGIGGSSSEIISKDNCFRLFRNNELGAGSIISIGDLENEKYYTCKIMFMKKMKTEVKRRINDKKIRRSISEK